MLSRLPPRARMILLGVVGSAAAFFVFGGARRGCEPNRPADPFDAVPRDAFIVATLNVDELRRSPIYEVLFGTTPRARQGTTTQTQADEHDGASALGSRALGLSSLVDACGFDPITRVDRLALAVPEHGEKGELGVAARVTVSRDELSRCTRALAGERGGEAVATEVGSFVVVEEGPTSEGPRARLGYGRGGLLVVGRGAWFDAMLAAADGRAPSAKAPAPSAKAPAPSAKAPAPSAKAPAPSAKAPAPSASAPEPEDANTHATLRVSLTSRDGWRSPTLLVTMLLPSSLRERIKREMTSELQADREGEPEHEAEGAMAGVLGVSSLGLAVRAGGVESIDLAAELTCESERACTSVEKLLVRERQRWSKELALRMIGLGPLLDSIDVKRDSVNIRVTASAPADQLAGALRRVLRLKSRDKNR